MSLVPFGWNAWFESHRSRLDGLVPVRVVADLGAALRVTTGDATMLARPSGRMRHGAVTRLDLPAVGDFGGVREGQGDTVLDVLLPRSSCLVRQAAGTKPDPQPLAANVDLAIVVMALDADFSARRLERWAQLIAASGALPLVLLNKSDLCEDAQPLADEARRCMPDAQVLVASAANGFGLDALREALRPGSTAVLLGASGVGKSTTLNALLGAQAQPTRPVRAHDGRGMHVTTARQLFELPHGALLIDTPGIREIAGWALEEEVATFPDIDDAAIGCRFRDCSHGNEPGCAVAAAIAAGDLDASRLLAFRKLQREAAFNARRQDSAAARTEKLRWKSVTKAMRHRPKTGR